MMPVIRKDHPALKLYAYLFPLSFDDKIIKDDPGNEYGRKKICKKTYGQCDGETPDSP
jgi:hypothetical protein